MLAPVAEPDANVGRLEVWCRIRCLKAEGRTFVTLVFGYLIYAPCPLRRPHLGSGSYTPKSQNARIITSPRRWQLYYSIISLLPEFRYISSGTLWPEDSRNIFIQHT